MTTSLLVCRLLTLKIIWIILAGDLGVAGATVDADSDTSPPIMFVPMDTSNGQLGSFSFASPPVSPAPQAGAMPTSLSSGIPETLRLGSPPGNPSPQAGAMSANPSSGIPGSLGFGSPSVNPVPQDGAMPTSPSSSIPGTLGLGNSLTNPSPQPGSGSLEDLRSLLKVWGKNRVSDLPAALGSVSSAIPGPLGPGSLPVNQVSQGQAIPMNIMSGLMGALGTTGVPGPVAALDRIPPRGAGTGNGFIGKFLNGKNLVEAMRNYLWTYNVLPQMLGIKSKYYDDDTFSLNWSRRMLELVFLVMERMKEKQKLELEFGKDMQDRGNALSNSFLATLLQEEDKMLLPPMRSRRYTGNGLNRNTITNLNIGRRLLPPPGSGRYARNAHSSGR